MFSRWRTVTGWTVSSPEDQTALVASGLMPPPAALIYPLCCCVSTLTTTLRCSLLASAWSASQLPGRRGRRARLSMASSWSWERGWTSAGGRGFGAINRRCDFNSWRWKMKGNVDRFDILFSFCFKLAWNLYSVITVLFWKGFSAVILYDCYYIYPPTPRFHFSCFDVVPESVVGVWMLELY